MLYIFVFFYFLSISVPILISILFTKGGSNYGINLWYNQKSSHPKFFIHFFIDNSNANISLYALSCPNFNLGQLKVCKLMFALELSMKK